MPVFPKEFIRLLLAEIESWQAEGLISASTAHTLRYRYQPPPPAPVKPAAPQASAPPAPRPSLAQTLFSEASIKIFLYLGAFFVIAAALISAVLIELLRLPILAGAAFFFGAGALALQKRLPQPSFILWIVFSALLPTAAGALSDLLHLHGPAAAVYWTFAWAGMTGMGLASVWLYRSRFFTLAAFGALSACAWYAADIFTTLTEPHLFLLLLAASGGIWGVRGIKRWQGARFALPLFVLIHVFVLAVLFVDGIQVMNHLTKDETGLGWMFSALTWLTAAGIYLQSQWLFPFAAFPCLMAGALTPVAWLAVTAFDPPQFVYALAWTAQAAVLAIGGEAARLLHFRRAQEYGTPLLLFSLPLFFVGAGVAWWETAYPWLGFAILGGAAILLSLAQGLKSRWWVWIFAAAAWSGAYFSVFGLPPVTALEIDIRYILTGWALLLALPDLVLSGDIQSRPALRWILRLYLLLPASLIPLAAMIQNEIPATLALAALAILGLGFSLRFRQGWFLIPFQGYGTLALWSWLAQNPSQPWMPILSAWLGLCYLAGMALTWRRKENTWGSVLRRMALFSSLFLLPLGSFYQRPGFGWYVALLTLPFILETFARLPWLEAAVHLLFGISLAYLLMEWQNTSIERVLFAFSLLWLGGDLLFRHFLAARRVFFSSLLPRLAGAAVTLAVSGLLLINWHTANLESLTYSLGLAALLWLVALLYRQKALIYWVHAIGAIAVLQLTGLAHLHYWSLALIALAVLYAVLAYLDLPKGWGAPRRVSALALASPVSLAVLFNANSLWETLPAAITGTLWAVEAFRRRNVWLGFPANSFYLLAYFILLYNLNVNEPQFFSVGAAALGMVMHLLLVRTGKYTGAFLTGMVSQFILLGTTYIQMVAQISLGLFTALFFQSLAVLFYGLVIRSRSLVFTPITFVVLGVLTVVFNILQGFATLLMVGCTGVFFLVLGIVAILMRERLGSLRGQLGNWRN